MVAAGFVPKREGAALVAGGAALDDAAGAVVVVAGNKEGFEAGADAAAGAVVDAVDAGVGNNDGLAGAPEVAILEPPRLWKIFGEVAAVVVAAVLAGVVVVVVVVEAGFAPKRGVVVLVLLSAGLAAGAPAPKRDGDEVPPVEAANRPGFSAAPVAAGLVPKRVGAPELLAAGWDAGVEADPLPKRFELGCDVAPAAPPKRLLV